MYCVIGEEILPCELKRKDEPSSLCKVGSSPKEQLIANTHLFDTRAQAARFIASNKLAANKPFDFVHTEPGIIGSVLEHSPASMSQHMAKLKQASLETTDKIIPQHFHSSFEQKIKNNYFEPQKKFTPQKSFGFKGK